MPPRSYGSGVVVSYIFFYIFLDFSFDGVEYRLIKHLLKSWKIQHILRDQSKTGLSPWVTMFVDLRNHTADLAMCSIWTSEIDDTYDVSSYYNHECNTLLVPKPKRLSEISAIYATLRTEVWFTFALLFFATAMLLWGCEMIDSKPKGIYFLNLSGSFLDVMNIATSHGVESFWKQKSSTKILLLRYIKKSKISLQCTTLMYGRITFI